MRRTCSASPAGRVMVGEGAGALQRVACTLLAAGLFGALGCAKPAGFDPVTQDPDHYPAAFPPALQEISVSSHGALLNGIVYEAAGPGPHPAVLLLHGFPGNERNLDLAQALRRAGWTVVFFHYRGAWGSGGDFSITHVLEDVERMLDVLANPEFARRHRIEPRRISLVGHSMGGFAALLTASERPDVYCAISMAGANMGGMASGMADDPTLGAAMAARLDGWSGPLAGTSGAALVAEVAAAQQRFDLRNHAAGLAGRPVLLVAAAQDEVAAPEFHHHPVASAIRARNAAGLDEIVIPGDHSFSQSRIQLARRVIGWMREHCR